MLWDDYWVGWLAVVKVFVWAVALVVVMAEGMVAW